MAGVYALVALHRNKMALADGDFEMRFTRLKRPDSGKFGPILRCLNQHFYLLIGR